jgi:mycothiol system anti-sigma-R factor
MGIGPCDCDEGWMVMSEQVPSMNPFDRSECDETIHELYHFLDGELTEERRNKIEFHLNHCGPCVDIVDFESELRRVIADRCREKVPEELRNKIAQLINHELDASQSGS